METITGGLLEVSPDTIEGNEELPLSVDKVLSNDDIFYEILLRLPVVSLVLFKSVSKRWSSFIKDDTFMKRRSRVLDPPCGLITKPGSWLNKNKLYALVPFDIRIPMRFHQYIFKRILHSCNGLFLCYIKTGVFCVHNPTINSFKLLPKPFLYEKDQFNFTRMDFDPTKSPHYKVVHATHIDDDYFQIEIYSSETGIWSIVCDHSDPLHELWSGIYWNDAIHWLHFNYHHYKLDFANKTVVKTKIPTPVTMGRVGEMFASRGCLLLIGKDESHSHQLNVYEMRDGDSEWSIRYSIKDLRITLGDIKGIALGERFEDSFMVLKGSNNFVLYKFGLKSLCELPESQSMLPKQTSYIDSFLYPAYFLFTASFACV